MSTPYPPWGMWWPDEWSLKANLSWMHFMPPLTMLSMPCFTTSRHGHPFHCHFPAHSRTHNVYLSCNRLPAHADIACLFAALFHMGIWQASAWFPGSKFHTFTVKIIDYLKIINGYKVQSITDSQNANNRCRGYELFTPRFLAGDRTCDARYYGFVGSTFAIKPDNDLKGMVAWVWFPCNGRAWRSRCNCSLLSHFHPSSPFPSLHTFEFSSDILDLVILSPWDLRSAQILTFSTTIIRAFERCVHRKGFVTIIKFLYCILEVRVFQFSTDKDV